MNNKLTLRQLIDKLDARGLVRIDDGNGSAGPLWIAWDDDVDQLLGDVVMHPVRHDDKAYEGNKEGSTKEVCLTVATDYWSSIMYASDWIDGDDWRTDNPYRYRLIIC